MISISRRMKWIAIEEVDQSDGFQHFRIETKLNDLLGVVFASRLEKGAFVHLSPVKLVEGQRMPLFHTVDDSCGDWVSLTVRERNKMREMIEQFLENRTVQKHEEESRWLICSSDNLTYERLSEQSFLELLEQHRQLALAEKIQQAIRNGLSYRLGSLTILSQASYQFLQQLSNVPTE